MTAAADSINYKPIIDNVELVKLHEFGLILNSTHNIDLILKESAKAIREILDAEGCHVLLAKGIRNELHLETAIHDGGKPFPPSVDETRGISGRTFLTGAITIIEDAETDPRVTRKMYQHFGHKSLISAPIVVKGKVVGAIVAYSMLPSMYTGRDGEFLIMLGNHLGLALENARLMNELQKAAFTDPLTGAYNRGYFRDELDQLLKGQPDDSVSLIMMDVNDLKLINDTYGHTMGDFVLQEVTELLKQNVRGMDIVARYGGDEFAIILPGAEMDEAKQVALRIEQSVKERSFCRDGTQIKVSMSWGTMTTRGEEMPNMNHIIDAADRKLYNMKKYKSRVSHLKKL